MKTKQSHIQEFQHRITIIFVGLVVATFTLLQPAFADDSNVTMDVSGRWEVLPANKSSISTFVVGELDLIQTGNEINGSYILNKKGKIDVCSSSRFEVSGFVRDDQVVLSAVGSKSRLSGSATGDSDSLRGSGMEFFEGTMCSGYVQSAFIMHKL